MFIHLILLIVAFAANFLAALSGGGAGFIQFPILIFLGLPFALALGTHKVAVVFLGLGTIFKKRHDLNKFDWRMSMLMIFIGCPAVILGTVSIIEVNDSIAKVVLGLLTIGIGRNLTAVHSCSVAGELYGAFLHRFLQRFLFIRCRIICNSLPDKIFRFQHQNSHRTVSDLGWRTLEFRGSPDNGNIRPDKLELGAGADNRSISRGIYWNLLRK